MIDQNGAVLPDSTPCFDPAAPNPALANYAQVCDPITIASVPAASQSVLFVQKYVLPVDISARMLASPPFSLRVRLLIFVLWL